MAQQVTSSTRSTNSTSLAKKSGLERIVADLADFKRGSDKYPFINVLSFDEKLFECHCNIALNDVDGKFCGIVVHFVLNFPKNYPLKAPTITMETDLSNGKKMSLNKFVVNNNNTRSNKQGKNKKEKKEYTIESVLMQVQSFLFSKKGINNNTIESKSSGNNAKNVKNKVKKSVKVYKISDDNDKDDEKKSTAAKENVNTADEEEKHLENNEDKTTGTSISTISDTNNNNNDKNGEKCMGFVIKVHFYERADKLHLYHHTINDAYNNSIDNTLKNIIYASKNIHPKIIEAINNKIGDYDLISYIDSEYKLISKNEFDQMQLNNKHKNKNKNNKKNKNSKHNKNNENKNNKNSEVFTHFIPIDLNPKHGKLSMQLLEKSILNIFSSKIEHDAHNLDRDYNECRYLCYGRGTNLIPRAEEAFTIIFDLYSSKHMYRMSLNELKEYVNDIYSSSSSASSCMNDMISFFSTNYAQFGDSITLKQFLSYYVWVGYNSHVIAWKHLENMGFNSRLFKVNDAPIEIRRRKKTNNNKNHQKMVQEKKQDGDDDDCSSSVCSSNINNNNSIKKYHPLLSLYTISNIMKSLISRVIEMSEKNIQITIDDSINILSTFCKYHHLLLSIYYLNKKKLKPIIQDQINSFFNTDSNNGNKTNNNNIPDFGVFLMYLTLWENDNDNNNDELSWNNSNIGIKLLDELFTRQTGNVYYKYPKLSEKRNSTNDSRLARIRRTWNASLLSYRLFLVQYFFLKNVCKLYIFDNNKQFGKTKSNNKEKMLFLAVEFQKFVKAAYKCDNYDQFFKMLEMDNKNTNELSDWLLNCAFKSDFRYRC